MGMMLDPKPSLINSVGMWTYEKLSQKQWERQQVAASEAMHEEAISRKSQKNFVANEKVMPALQETLSTCNLNCFYVCINNKLNN